MPWLADVCEVPGAWWRSGRLVMGFVTLVGRVARRVLRVLVSANVSFDMAHPLILRRGSARRACRRMRLGDVRPRRGLWGGAAGRDKGEDRVLPCASERRALATAMGAYGGLPAIIWGPVSKVRPACRAADLGA